MRIRYGICSKAVLSGIIEITECDLSPARAKREIAKLKNNLLCEWYELVAEEDFEGGYMKIIESYHNPRAKMMLRLAIK